MEVWWGCGGSGMKALRKVGFKNIFFLDHLQLTLNGIGIGSLIIY
jgi:hypothetical protein